MGAQPVVRIWAIFVAWVFVNSTFVATTAIVVFLRDRPAPPPAWTCWAGAALDRNEMAELPGELQRRRVQVAVASNVEPTEFTATMAPTMMPLSRDDARVAEPSLHAAGDGRRLRSDIAPPARGPDRAALHPRRTEGGIRTVAERGAAPSRVEEDRRRNDRHDVAPPTGNPMP